MSQSKSQVPLKGAIIGFGFISSKGHFPAYLERARQAGSSAGSGGTDVEIIAIADICPERLVYAKSLNPAIRTYATYKELLAAEGKNLDFVDISTPPCDHAEIAHAAFEAGLHVLCEKPLTTTLEEAKNLMVHAQKAKRVLFPCHNYKHAPVVRAIREIIDSGQIGEVVSLTLSTFRNTHAKGVTEWKTNWRREHRYSGGGIAMDHGSHTFYLTFDWLGAYPTAVTARMLNHEPAKWDTEDSFSAVLSFPGDKSAHVHLTWNAGVRKVIYTVQGTRGAITVDDDDLQLSVIEKTDGPDVAQGAVRWKTERRSIASHWMDASHVSWFNSLFDQFKDAIANHDYIGKEAQEAYLCVQLIEAAYRSSKAKSLEQSLEPVPNLS